METKICKKCGKEKPLTEFYTHKEMLDGHLNFCKQCVKERVSEYRGKNIEKIREYDRNRPNAKERREKEFKDIKKDNLKYEKYKEQKKEWNKKNRLKKNAHCKVKRAIENGLLIKSDKCQICGKTNCNIQGHHTDYSKPLEIIWVCTECHGMLHRKYIR